MADTRPIFAHLAATRVEVPATFAVERLGDPAFVGGWALGSMNLEPLGGTLHRGRSLFDGSHAHVEIHVHAELGLIDYAVGDAEQRSARIFIRVTDGTVLDDDKDTCLVTLHALRPAGATPERWARTCTSHETEILLIRSQLERAYAEAGA